MKRAICSFLLLLTIFYTTSMLTLGTENGFVAVETMDGTAVLVDSQGQVQAQAPADSENAGAYAFTVSPGQTYYLSLGVPSFAATMLTAADGSSARGPVSAGALADSARFQLKNKKSGSGAGLVSIAQYNEKTLGDLERRSWLQFVVANPAGTEEMTASCQLTFCARRDDEQGVYSQDDTATLDVFLAIQAPVEKNGVALEPNEAANFHPSGGARNEIVWEDTASLSFTTSTDAADFPISLSTHGSDFYSLGDFSDAELFVRDFSETPALESASRVLLTLQNPWIVRADATPPAVQDCRIYEYDKTTRALTDVTELFTYQPTESGDAWQMKTRRLGCYILSNKKLDLTQRRTQVAGAAVSVSDEDAPTASAPSAPAIPAATLSAASASQPLLTFPYPKKVPNTGKYFLISMQ